MRNGILVIALFTILHTSPVQAGWKDILRPFAEKVLSQDLVSKIFGESTENLDEIEMPVLPQFEKSTKQAITRQFFNQDKLKPEQRNQYYQNFIEEVFIVVRQTKATMNDVGKWMNALTQGGSLEGFYRAQVLDDYYLGLENRNTPMSEKTVEFLVEFYKKFFGETKDPAKFKNVPFHAMKRIVVDKSLVMMDEIANQGEDDFYRWYAVFSGTLARQFPDLYKLRNRQMKRMTGHYKWAQTVPEQLVKGEVIIKLHKALNQAQFTNE